MEEDNEKDPQDDDSAEDSIEDVAAAAVNNSYAHRHRDDGEDEQHLQQVLSAQPQKATSRVALILLVVCRLIISSLNYY